MTDIKMGKKLIEASEWLERLQTFTSGNKGRASAIAAEGMTMVEASNGFVSTLEVVDQNGEATFQRLL